MAGRVVREREDGLSEYTVRPKSRRRPTIIQVGQTEVNPSTALPRRPEGGATPDNPIQAAAHGPAGRKGGGKDSRGDEDLVQEDITKLTGS